MGYKLTKAIFTRHLNIDREMGWGDDELLPTTMIMYNDDDRAIYMYRGIRAQRVMGVGATGNGYVYPNTVSLTIHHPLTTYLPHSLRTYIYSIQCYIETKLIQGK
jgi:hypothetical protein